MKLGFGWLMLGFLVVYSQAAQAQQTLHPAVSFENFVPFQLRCGFLIVVEGRVGSLAPLKFILDTGATRTVIDSKLAQKLSLSRRKGQLLNFDRSVKVDRTNLPELQLGSLTVRNLPVIVGDLKHLSGFAEGVDAIIGLDLLRASQSLLIDYQKGVVTFRTPSPDVLKDAKHAQVLTIQLPIQGQPVHLIVDTGLQGLLLYQDRVRRHLPELKLSGTISQAHVGRLTGQTATLAGIRVGSGELQSSALLLRHAPDSLPYDLDGYLGTEALHAQMIELDFASNTLRWQTK